MIYLTTTLNNASLTLAQQLTLIKIQNYTTTTSITKILMRKYILTENWKHSQELLD
jgi:hypothetical protein